MWMSGTSLAAPIVAGAAAQLLARHPEWTPDQVKGALMETATPLPASSGFSGGVGEVNAAAAAALTDPPNPNAGLDAFVVTDPVTGAITFDAAAWTAAVQSGAAWDAPVAGLTNWTQTDWTQTDWTQTDWTQTDWTQTDWTQ
jgi:subtilisin family serine protease